MSDLAHTLQRRRSFCHEGLRSTQLLHPDGHTLAPMKTQIRLPVVSMDAESSP